MIIKPILDKWEIKGIQSISTTENRALIEHTIPGLAGNLLQDMGEVSTSIIIQGTLPHADDIRDKFLEEVRKKFVAGEPIPFMADIITETDVKEVVISNFQITEIAGSAEPCQYLINLKEYIPPPEPAAATAMADIQTDIDLEADLGVQTTVQSLFDDMQAESSLTDLGLDTDKIGAVMDNMDSGQLNNFLDSIGDEGLGKFGEVLDGLGVDAIKQLAESLGLSLPLGGYAGSEEVLADLLGGVKGMVGGDSGEWGSVIGTTSGKIIGKLLLTLVGGGDGKTDWDGLTDTFKDTLGKLF